METAYTFQDQLSQISVHSDWSGRIKCHFCVPVTKYTQPPGDWFQNQLHKLCIYPSKPTQSNISPFGLICALQVLFLRFSHKINLAPWWLISKLAARTLHIPFRTNSVTYQPIGTDLGALSAISVFQSLNKLGPMVANQKIWPLS